MGSPFVECCIASSHFPSAPRPSSGAVGSERRRGYNNDFLISDHPQDESSSSGSYSASLSPSSAEDKLQLLSRDLDAFHSNVDAGIEELRLLERFEALNTEDETDGGYSAFAGTGIFDLSSPWSNYGDALHGPLDGSRKSFNADYSLTDSRLLSSRQCGSGKFSYEQLNNGGYRDSFDPLYAQSYARSHQNDCDFSQGLGLLNSQGFAYGLLDRRQYRPYRLASQPSCRALRHIEAYNYPDRFILQGNGQNLGRERMRHISNAHLEASLSPRLTSSLPYTKECIYHWARDPCGSRLLQGLISKENTREINTIFDEVVAHVVELMEDPSGNYLMQELLHFCSEEQRRMIIIMLTKDPSELIRISLNSHGTRAVQKLIETLNRSNKHEISLVIEAIMPGFLRLAKDANGKHVVEKCLTVLEAEDNKLIFEAAAQHSVHIGISQYGYHILQECISRSTGDLQVKLISEISAHGLFLAQDAYGNYVIQSILSLKNSLANAILISQFEGNYVSLSMQKFSSNVVEKCFKSFGEKGRSKIILELLSVEKFEEILGDKYANYVIQSALKTIKGHLRYALIEAIKPHADVLGTSPHCKRIFSLIC
ncbi:Putative pumilio like 8, chloroplastic [Apostasia shenzhenica]|uniref:Pumilio like 8, chloroplastic n=1 Tax=Apostasia shenzhenica TaxID=1088818 RepID=A0A2I0AY73_9ASPA|nr:Putative pumilio like 8, chloroplastic [Apostasia shenzhenica]